MAQPSIINHETWTERSMFGPTGKIAAVDIRSKFGWSMTIFTDEFGLPDVTKMYDNDGDFIIPSPLAVDHMLNPQHDPFECGICYQKGIIDDSHG